MHFTGTISCALSRFVTQMLNLVLRVWSIALQPQQQFVSAAKTVSLHDSSIHSNPQKQHGNIALQPQQPQHCIEERAILHRSHSNITLKLQQYCIEATATLYYIAPTATLHYSYTITTLKPQQFYIATTSCTQGCWAAQTSGASSPILSPTKKCVRQR